MQNLKPRFDAPIPGENYTSDVKNYPWHRPPEITDFDKAVEFVVEQVSKPSAITTIMSLMEAGANLTSIVSMLNMVNISNGRYAVDTSLLIAGPVARYLNIIAKKNDIDVKIGNENERQIITLEHLKALSGISADANEKDQVSPSEPQTALVSDVPMPSGGIMGVSEENRSETASAAQQEAMLGYSEDENEEGEA